MRRYHPKWRAALLVAGVLLVSGSGCSNQQTPLANPFLAPDRVPPPTTRSLAPGTAQPYYPGDPLPAIGSAITPPAATVTAAPATPAPPVAAGAAASLPGNATASAQPAPGTPAVAVANEGPVAIPGDDAGLRFALPTPAPPQVVPAAPVAAGPPVQFAAAPVQQPVQPALYAAPASPAMPAGQFAYQPVDPAQLGPWRAPRIASAPAAPTRASLAVSSAPVAPPVVVAPRPELQVASAQPGMSVRLRPVPSPAPDTELSPTPRVRLPGYASSFQQPVVPAGAVQPATYVAPAPGGGVVQTVQITSLPASGPATTGVATAGASVPPAVSAASQPTYVASASGDGFRPRGSTR